MKGVYKCEGELTVPSLSGPADTIQSLQELVIFVEGRGSEARKEIPWTVLYVIVGVVLVVLTILVICRYAIMVVYLLKALPSGHYIIIIGFLAANSNGKDLQLLWLEMKAVTSRVSR